MIPVMHSRDDVARRLQGTAAIYDGKVYFVSTRDPFINTQNVPPLAIDEINLYDYTFRADEVHSYDARKCIRVKYTDPSVQIKGLAGGYVNYTAEEVGLAWRDPSRVTFLGIHPNNTTFRNSHTINNTRVFYSKPMADTFLGNFPEYEKCYVEMKQKPLLKGRAFGREYALLRLDSNLLKLEVRGVGVALNIGQGDEFIPLNKKVFSIVEEELSVYNMKFS